MSFAATRTVIRAPAGARRVSMACTVRRPARFNGAILRAITRPCRLAVTRARPIALDRTRSCERAPAARQRDAADREPRRPRGPAERVHEPALRPQGDDGGLHIDLADVALLVLRPDQRRRPGEQDAAVGAQGDPRRPYRSRCRAAAGGPRTRSAPPPRRTSVPLAATAEPSSASRVSTARCLRSSPATSAPPPGWTKSADGRSGTPAPEPVNEGSRRPSGSTRTRAPRPLLARVPATQIRPEASTASGPPAITGSTTSNGWVGRPGRIDPGQRRAQAGVDGAHAEYEHAPVRLDGDRGSARVERGEATAEARVDRARRRHPHRRDAVALLTRAGDDHAAVGRRRDRALPVDLAQVEPAAVAVGGVEPAGRVEPHEPRRRRGAGRGVHDDRDRAVGRGHEPFDEDARQDRDAGAPVPAVEAPVAAQAGRERAPARRARDDRRPVRQRGDRLQRGPVRAVGVEREGNTAGCRAVVGRGGCRRRGGDHRREHGKYSASHGLHPHTPGARAAAA